MKKLCVVTAIGCAAVLALAGCGGGDNRTKFDVETLKSTYGYQWEDTSEPILNEDGLKDIKFNIYAPKDNSADDYNDMAIMDTLRKQTNVKVEWDLVNPSQYQPSLIFANHEGIDGVYHAGLTSAEIADQADRDRLLCISDYLKYMPNFSAILEKRPDIKRQITNAEDGKIYTLPRVEEMGLKQYPNFLFLNKAWTEKAIDANALTGVTKEQVKDGLSLTAEQMEALLKYFKENDMNGDGNANDERPMNFVAQNWQGNQCDLFGMFGINENPDHRVIKNGQVTYTYFDKAYYDAVSFIRGWVDKGYIDKVSFEQTQDNFLANGKSGKNATTDDAIAKGEKYGAFYWWESDTVVTKEENYICCAPLKGPSDYNGHNYSNCQTVCISNTPEIDVGELFFFKGVPNAEVLLTYFDRYYMPDISAQINYGPIGIAFEEEKVGGMLKPKASPEGKTADEIRLKFAPLGICYLTDTEWGHTVEMEPRAQLRLQRINDYVKPYLPEDVTPVPNLQYTLSELDKMDRYTAIETQMNQLILYLHQGTLTKDSWTKYINGLKSDGVGVNKVLEIYQAAYDRVK